MNPAGTPALPAAARGQLQDGAGALGFALSAPQTDRLLSYLQLIQRWTQVYNLTAVRDTDGILVQHLLDSLALLPGLRRHTGGEATRLLDVGSGAGLPGLPLAVVAPELQVTCVDAVAKKVGFMRQAIAALALDNAVAVHARVEDLPGGSTWDVVTSRAFSSLGDFVGLTAPFLAPGACWMAMKGKVPSEEIATLPGSVEVFHVEPIRVPRLPAERCLVWMRPRAPEPAAATGAGAR